MRDYEREYRKAIGTYLECDPENLFFYWKGRVALYAILKAMGIGEGDEVIVQGYTCVVVPNAIFYLGATPIYADIDLDTYNVNLDSLKAKISERTKVIICQNTFGLSSNLEEISRIAKEAEERYGHPVYTLEDCTHGFGGRYHDKPNGNSCDASFFSTQWSKPYTTGLGGFCVVHNSLIKRRLKGYESDKIKPGIMELFELRLMYIVRQYIINDFTYWPMVTAYRWMSKRNLVVGSSSGEEISGIVMPQDFFKAQSSMQYKKGLQSIRKLRFANTMRKENARIYSDCLKAMGKRHIDEKLFDDHIFLRYPILVNDREHFREDAEKAKVILGEWFDTPIYPVHNDLSTWQIDEKQIPNAMYASKHMVNLPTEVSDPEKVVRFIQRHENMIL